MIRGLKAAGVCFVAAIALGAAAAAAAQAEEFFHSHKATTIFTGESLGPQTFTLPVIGGGKLGVECAGAKLAGTETGAEHKGSLGTTFTMASVLLHPEYFGSGGPGTACKFKGVPSALPVHTAGCYFKLTAQMDVNGHGQTHLECGTGALEITFTSGSTCVIKFPTQTPTTGGVHYKNNKLGTTTEWAVEAFFTVEGIKFTSNNAGACMLVGIPKEGTASYTGEFIIRGFEDLEKTETGVYKEGKQTGIWQGPTE